jgi:hypothetical protein
MMACVIADHYLRQRGQVGDNPGVAVCATGALTARRGAKTKIWTTLNNVSALR